MEAGCALEAYTFREWGESARALHSRKKHGVSPPRRWLWGASSQALVLYRFLMADWHVRACASLRRPPGWARARWLWCCPGRAPSCVPMCNWPVHGLLFVGLTRLGTCGLAPASSSSRTSSVWPLLTASCSGSAPDCGGGGSGGCWHTSLQVDEVRDETCKNIDPAQRGGKQVTRGPPD